MAEASGSVQGKFAGPKITFYGLSTCIWCKRTRQFLEEQGLGFDFFYVDLLQGTERESILEQVRRWNPKVSFPTVVLDDTRCIVGFRPDEIKEALGL